MIPFRDVIKKAGGERALIKALGFPVSSFMLNIWRRNGYIPDGYQKQVAALIDVSVSELQPDDDDPVLKMKHRAVGAVYRSLVYAAGLNIKAAAKVHDVDVTRVELWIDGFEEAPVSAFIEIYNAVSGRAKEERLMTLDHAMAISGLNQSQLCDRLGVTRAMGTHWKNKGGRIPALYARKIMEIWR